MRLFATKLASFYFALFKKKTKKKKKIVFWSRKQDTSPSKEQYKRSLAQSLGTEVNSNILTFKQKAPEPATVDSSHRVLYSQKSSFAAKPKVKSSQRIIAQVSSDCFLLSPLDSFRKCRRRFWTLQSCWTTTIWICWTGPAPTCCPSRSDKLSTCGTPARATFPSWLKFPEKITSPPSAGYRVARILPSERRRFLSFWFDLRAFFWNWTGRNSIVRCWDNAVEAPNGRSQCSCELLVVEQSHCDERRSRCSDCQSRCSCSTARHSNVSGRARSRDLRTQMVSWWNTARKWRFAVVFLFYLDLIISCWKETTICFAFGSWAMTSLACVAPSTRLLSKLWRGALGNRICWRLEEEPGKNKRVQRELLLCSHRFSFFSDRKIRFWNSSTGACLNVVDTHSQVCSILWSKHSKELVSSHGFSQNQVNEKRKRK